MVAIAVVAHAAAAVVFLASALPADDFAAWQTWHDARIAEGVTEARAPARAPVVPAGVEQWRDLVAGYGWDTDEALAVIMCESRGVPTAANPTSSAVGLFQVKPEYWGDGRDLTDPVANADAAWRAYVAGGHSWRYWVCQP